MCENLCGSPGKQMETAVQRKPKTVLSTQIVLGSSCFWKLKNNFVTGTPQAMCTQPSALRELETIKGSKCCMDFC